MQSSVKSCNRDIAFDGKSLIKYLKNIQPVSVPSSTSSSRRTPKIDVGEFPGDKNQTEAFLEKFLQAASMYGWNDIQRIQFFPCYLNGPAAA